MGGWRNVEEIEAYRLACELRDRIHAVVDAGRAAQDYDFSQQLRRSTASAASNLSEGFERYYHGEFAYFTSMAKASLGETINHLVSHAPESASLNKSASPSSISPTVRSGQQPDS
jgi:four helix bundle protein